jgi:thiol-disulfide isomerase/thioredoxin
MTNIKSTPILNYTQQFNKSVVIFGSYFCEACKQVTSIFVPVFEKVYTDIEFMFIDCNKFENEADLYNINQFPTLIYFENGVEVKRICSGSIKEITNYLFK